MKSLGHRYIEGKDYSQDDLIPIIILIIGIKGGRASKMYVEEKVYEVFHAEFSKACYHETIAGGVPRWKHDVAWARERAKQLHGYIKPPEESGRGQWELTLSGKDFYAQLVEQIRKLES